MFYFKTFVVVVDRNRKNLFRASLADNIIIEDYVDLDDGPDKEAAETKLRADIAAACSQVPEKQLLRAVTSRLPDLTAISAEAKQQAITLAQEYAINDAETPDDVDAINTRISAEMGDFHNVLKRIKAAGEPLLAMEANLTKLTGETDRILKLKLGLIDTAVERVSVR